MVIMKKLTLGVIVALGIAVIVANQSGKKSGQNTESTPAPSAYTLVVVNPDVMLKKSGESDFRKVSTQTDIAAGAEIKTSASGKARLLYPNGTVTDIEKDSHIKLEALDAQGNKSRIRIVVGGIWSKIKNVLGTSDYYEVETENTVASVRGTIFWMEFRNKITNVTGIENTVRVRAKDIKTNTVIDGSDVNVESGQETNVDAPSVASRRLAARTLSNEDFRDNALRERILNHVEQEDLKKEQVQKIVRRVAEQNANDNTFIKRLIEQRLVEQGASPTPTRSAPPTVRPSSSPKPTVTVTPRVSAIPTVTPLASSTPTPRPSATPEPTATATPAPLIPTAESLSPKSISATQEFVINGRNFKNSRGDVSYVAQVLISGVSVSKFNVLDSLTIFATAAVGSYPGTYDVTIVSTTGEKSTLSQALTIQ